MFQLVDALALKWLDWRYDGKAQAYAKEHPEQGFVLHRAEIGEDGMFIDGTSPAIAFLAAEAAKMLDRANASNYLQFDMVPHVAADLRAVRVTVQWRNGLSPAQRADKLNEFVLAFDTWDQSPELCVGPLFDAMIEARSKISSAVRKTKESK
jgi:hypothetical protein